MTVRILAWALILLGAATCLAAPLETAQRFNLINGCRPVPVHLRTPLEGSGDAKAIGLIEGQLQDAAESRLRAARLYKDSFEAGDNALLHVHVGVTRRSLSASVSYLKRLRDPFGSVGFAPTWSRRTVGEPGKDAEYIVSSLSGYMDEFIAAYLRVNESACASGGKFRCFGKSPRLLYKVEPG